MKKILSIGMIRGLLTQVAGMAIGFGLVTFLQMLSGQPLKAEPAWVVGGFISALSFLIGLGIFADWFRMARGDEVPEPEEVEEPRGLRRYWGVSYDHKVIGVQYAFLSLFLLAMGGSFALIFRVELAQFGITDVARPPFLAWEAESGGVYRVQSTPSLIVTNWLTREVVTSMWDGIWSWTNFAPTGATGMSAAAGPTRTGPAGGEAPTRGGDPVSNSPKSRPSP